MMPNPAELTIRAFAPGDVDALAYAFMHWDYSDAEVLDWMRSKLDEWDWGRVGEANGRIVGYLLMADHHIDQLFILPGYQGRGLGNTLLGAAIARGIRPLTLNVFEENYRARIFYGRRGFSEAERWFNAQDKAVELRYLRP